MPAIKVLGAFLKKRFDIDWVLILAVLPIVGTGLITMNSFTGETPFFERQLIWLCISFFVFFVLSAIDWRFLRRTDVVVALFTLSCFTLLFLLGAGTVVKGAKSWFNFGSFSFQPVEPIKLVLILLLAKYFSRRHIEIAHIRHILVSGFYALVIFLLVFLQPDLGSAVIIFLIWLGMTLISGLSKKHLLAVLSVGILCFSVLWFYVFEDYQKNRVLTFIHPLTDVRGAGYNANQSTIAVGSGEFFGKGVGYGTQSRLKFLPEYETDFIFAAFAEEWGFVGVLILFALYGILIWRVLLNSLYGAGNFETLFGVGLAVFFISHFIIHVGMNIGVLPVTGISIPFMSYGGTNLLTSFVGLGILMGMRRYRRTVNQEIGRNEIPGIR